MDIKNLVIIGSGPAGYTAAIYTARAGIETILFEGFKSGIPGGQLMTTTIVENFPGFKDGIMGAELMENMKKQALRFDVKVLKKDVDAIDLQKDPYEIIFSDGKILTRSIIIATGATPKRLSIKGAGDNEFWQKGVSTCAVCDGAAPIFRDKEIFVIGGGDSAAEEALFLTKFAKKVFIVHRRDRLRASNILAKKAMEHPKIEVLWNTEIIEILGDKIVKEVVLLNNQTNERKKTSAGGVFFAIGHIPNTSFLKDQIVLDDRGYILIKKSSSQTNKEGVFACGDVQDPVYRQAIVASGSGCMAALDAQKWLLEKGYLI